MGPSSLVIAENGGIMTFYNTKYLTPQEQIDIEEKDPLLDQKNEDESIPSTAKQSSQSTDAESTK